MTHRGAASHAYISINKQTFPIIPVENLLKLKFDFPQLAQRCKRSVMLSKWQPSSVRPQLCAEHLISLCSSLQCLTESLKAAASPLSFKLWRLSNDIDSRSLSRFANDCNSYWLCFPFSRKLISATFPSVRVLYIGHKETWRNTQRETVNRRGFF